MRSLSRLPRPLALAWAMYGSIYAGEVQAAKPKAAAKAKSPPKGKGVSPASGSSAAAAPAGSSAAAAPTAASPAAPPQNAAVKTEAAAPAATTAAGGPTPAPASKEATAPAGASPAASPVAAVPAPPRPAPGSILVSTLLPASDSPGYQDGSGAQARFDGVEGAVLLGKDLYLSDSGNAVIRRVNLATGVVATVAGTAGKAESIDGSFAEARFYKPGPLVASASTLYVAQLATENGGSCIRSLDLAAQRTATLAGDCKRKGNQDGARGTALFNSPRALALDGNTLYVGDYTRVRAVALPSGAVSTVAGEEDARCDFGLQRLCKGGFIDGVGNEARLTGIRALAVVGRTLYIVDGDSLRALDLEARRLTTILGSARSSTAKDGIGAQAQLFSVGSILPSSDGLFLLQTSTFAGLRYLNSQTKALVSLTGLALPPFVRGSSNVDGPAANADFRKPRHLVQQGTQVLIIHEHGRIRAFERF